MKICWDAFSRASASESKVLASGALLGGDRDLQCGPLVEPSTSIHYDHPTARDSTISRHHESRPQYLIFDLRYTIMSASVLLT